MKAIVRDRYGPPEVLELVEIDRPAVGDGEVLVRVHAAAVNAADRYLLRGQPYLVRLAFGLRAPRNRVFGRDLAGRVEAVGRDVRGFRPGDEVYAEADRGSFAEYACLPEDRVAPKPGNLTFEQAAAVPLAGNTALCGLRGRVRSGTRVLVNGASGGVGTFAVQIAKAYGAEVTAVCRTRNVDLVRSLGADRVIDYTREDFTRTGDRYDLVFDLAGNHPLAALRRALAPDGTLLLSSGNGGRWLGPVGRMLGALARNPLTRQRLVPLTVSTTGENLRALTELIESGAVSPVVERTYPLSETADAMRHLEAEHARAKIVITV